MIGEHLFQLTLQEVVKDIRLILGQSCVFDLV